MSNVGLIVFMIVLFLIGILCLFFPAEVQSIAIKSVTYGSLTRNSYIESFIRSNRYIIVVRAVGFLAIIMFVLLAWVSLRSSSL